MRKHLTLVAMVLLLVAPVICYQVMDNYIEGTAEHVDGTFEKECNYWAGGGLQNSSNPLNWVQIDGKTYIAREVDFRKFDNTGDSIIGEFQEGDRVNMTLFPYQPYNFFWDTPMFFMLIILPFTLFLGFFIRFSKGDAK